jgi:hypothetical protein
MIVDTAQKTKNGTRWTKDDVGWLKDTCEYLRLDGFPSTAKMLEKEVEKLEES